jgi:hypothetical protein
MAEVGREVIFQNGSHLRVNIWHSGWVLVSGGVRTRGFRGEELTIEVRDVLTPVCTLNVEEGE